MLMNSRPTILAVKVVNVNVYVFLYVGPVMSWEIPCADLTFISSWNRIKNGRVGYSWKKKTNKQILANIRLPVSEMIAMIPHSCFHHLFNMIYMCVCLFVCFCCLFLFFVVVFFL